ncbi:MAG TPA: acetamidase/formamidase family protein [Planctomycetota bacterium]|nr:acetamidase/formamidase family protein [Planctomycetota bacterium]
MQRIPRSQALGYEIDYRKPPVLHVKEGEVFEVETEDAASGRLRSAATLPTLENRPELGHYPPLVNPVAGPIHVEGARPGDLLAVTIEDIEVPSQGFTILRPGVGPLTDSRRWMGDTGAYTHIFRHEPGPSGAFKDGVVHFNDRISWPVRPFIGTLATATEHDVPTSGFGQGPYGGNLDVRDFCPGNTVLLNVYQPGGLLFAGDVHGSQADTEFTGTANEIRSVLRLSLRVVRGKRIPFPRVLKKESIVFLGIDKPLESAVTRALVAFMEWLVEEHGVAPRDAYILSSVHPDVRVHVYQMIPGFPLDYVAGVEFPLRGP